MKPKKPEDDIAQQFKAALNQAIADEIMADLNAALLRHVRATKRRKKKA